MGTGDRSRERREALQEAARRAVLAHGADVKLIHVANHAGVTSGAVLYHYPDFDELLVEAHRSGVQRFHSARLAAIEGVADPVAALRVLVPLGLPSGSDDLDVRLLVELSAAAGRDGRIADLLNDLFDREVAMYESVLVSGEEQGLFRLGVPAETLARTIVSLEDAYGQVIVAKHPVIERDAAVELILDVVRLGTGHPLAAAA